MRSARIAHRNIVFMFFLMAIAAPLCAFAQVEISEEVPPPTPDLMTFLMSKAGIVGLTILLVQAIKRGAADLTGWQKIPNWAYALVIACGLTVLAVVIFETIDGVWWKIAIESAMNAALASGIFSIAHQPLAAPQHAEPVVKEKLKKRARR